MTRIFVDGEAGTVGLALHPHLAQMLATGEIRSVSVLANDLRKDSEQRAAAMAEADIVVLCLPDAAAVDAVALVQKINPAARILDASASHRVRTDWTYGLPELQHDSSQADLIRNARYVANPGCFATGCILLAKPLSNRQQEIRVAFQGITGYSAGGRSHTAHAEMPWLVQLSGEHRHLREIAYYGNIIPALTTIVGDWYQGMLIQATLPFSALQVFVAYQRAYSNYPDIEVTLVSPDAPARISAQAANNTNRVLLTVAPQPHGGCTVVAVLDNLGKGSAGAAADNLKLMLHTSN
jgi:N-acetyl-gamma-glutamyl-phosphate reductase